MTRWAIAAVLAAGVLVAVVGCMNIEVPEGPYVKLDDGPSTSTSTKANAKFTKDFLEDAKKEGVITESQYKDLCKRLDSACKL